MISYDDYKPYIHDDFAIEQTIYPIGQRESFFRSRDENESFSDSISFIETRPRVPDTYSQASRRDREKISSNLGHRDEIEIYYLHSQASRREREFP